MLTVYTLELYRLWPFSNTGQNHFEIRMRTDLFFIYDVREACIYYGTQSQMGNGYRHLHCVFPSFRNGNSI